VDDIKMEKELKFYSKFSRFYYIFPLFLIFYSIVNLVVHNNNKDVFLPIFIILISVLYLLFLLRVNVFNGSGYTINEKGILLKNIIYSKFYTWRELINYYIENKNGIKVLKFQTEKTIKNKYKKYAIVIYPSSPFYENKMHIEELIKKVNDIRGYEYIKK
jgi:hypothetical protein